jgi:hypothetical protein
MLLGENQLLPLDGPDRSSHASIQNLVQSETMISNLQITIFIPISPALDLGCFRPYKELVGPTMRLGIHCINEHGFIKGYDTARQTVFAIYTTFQSGFQANGVQPRRVPVLEESYA